MRHFILWAAVLLLLGGCSNPEGPEVPANSSIEGTWIQYLPVRDEFGGECVILSVRIALQADGDYLFEFYSADTSDPDCEVFLVETGTGSWMASEGVLSFEPALCCGAGSGGEYSIEEGRLVFGSFELERES